MLPAAFHIHQKSTAPRLADTTPKPKPSEAKDSVSQQDYAIACVVAEGLRGQSSQSKEVFSLIERKIMYLWMTIYTPRWFAKSHSIRPRHERQRETRRNPSDKKRPRTQIEDRASKDKTSPHRAAAPRSHLASLMSMFMRPTTIVTGKCHTTLAQDLTRRRGSLPS